VGAVQDVRATYLRFPGWTQHFWTWQTGKALPGQRPLVRHTWASYVALTLVIYFAGLGLSAYAVAAMFPFWYLALLGGWILTLSGARTMVLVIAHQALHRRFSGDARTDWFFGELVTVLTVFQNFQAFKDEHFDSHHRREVFATLDDPPVQVLLGLGFRPGVAKARQWRRAWQVFLSPKFYWLGFLDRARCNVLTGTWRRAGFVAWAGFWLSTPFWLPHGVLVLLLAFVVPVILLAQLSALLDKLGEHAWLTQPNPHHASKFYTVEATSARYCGSPVPAKGTPVRTQSVAWVRWIASTLFYHLPCRLTVIVGDLPNHDYHHRYPATPDWTTAAYARQTDIDQGPEGPPYTEVWGMGAAIGRVLGRLEEVPPDASMAR